jgi:5'-nucleotidase / UDP-sugar diphosphatase
VQANEAEGRQTLILMAGDLLMGSIYSTVWKGTVGVELMDKMGFTAMVVGNHEFDYGIENVLDNLKPNKRFTLLSANIKKKNGTRPFKGLVVKKLPASSEKILIFGLTTPDTPISTLPSNVKDLIFEDPAAVAQRILMEYGNDYLVIALTHLGLENDRKLASLVPKIDVIIGGHSHDAVFEPVVAGNALVCQAGAYAKFVGRLDLDIVRGRIVGHKGELIPLTSEIREDPQIASVLKGYTDRLDSRLNEVIGRSEVFLDGTEQTLRLGKPSNLGELLARIIAVNSNVEAAMINGGSIRGSIRQGDITLKDAYEVLPFPNTVVRLDLKGRDILAVLKQSADLRTGSGGKLQVYGISSRLERDRVVIDKIGDRDYSPDAIYSVATNNFLFDGGDGYGIFKIEKTKAANTGLSVRDLFVTYVRTKKVITP